MFSRSVLLFGSIAQLCCSVLSVGSIARLCYSVLLLVCAVMIFALLCFSIILLCCVARFWCSVLSNISHILSDVFIEYV